MDINPALTAFFCEQERKLAVAKSVSDEITNMLADDVMEFGTSGRCYTKTQILSEIEKRPVSGVSLQNFSVRMLAEELALVTYLSRIEINGVIRCARRSSIWKKIQANSWKIIFHQATLTDC